MVLVVGLAGVAGADWSQEIFLWRNPIEENIGPSPMTSCIAVDAQENVHVVYSYLFWRETEPLYVCQGLAYLKFDDHGNLLTGPTFLSDSLDEAGGLPKIRFFNSDSFLVMWWGGQSVTWPHTHGFKVRTMHVDGYPQGPWRTFSDTLWWSGFNYAFDIASDDRIVFAFPDTAGAIRVVVEYPNGERFMDHAVVWQQWPCDELDGFVDDTDSLQLAWRQRTGGDAIYAKRVAINVPFDPTHLADHVALTPVGHAIPILRPLGDSLLTFLDGGAEETFCDYRLRLLTRSDYAQVSQVLLGPCAFDPWDDQIGVEADTLLSLFTYVDFTVDRDLHFQRYEFPELQLHEDTAVIRRAVQGGGVGLRAYAVSSEGARHVVYMKSGAPGVDQLYYRYWRSDLSAREPMTEPASEQFAVMPNPSYGTFQLKGPLREVIRLSVWNLLGQKVTDLPVGDMANQTFSPALSPVLSTGVYFLRIETRKSIVLQKFVLIR